MTISLNASLKLRHRFYMCSACCVNYKNICKLKNNSETSKQVGVSSFDLKTVLIERGWSSELLLEAALTMGDWWIKGRRKTLDEGFGKHSVMVLGRIKITVFRETRSRKDKMRRSGGKMDITTYSFAERSWLRIRFFLLKNKYFSGEALHRILIQCRIS